MSFNQFQRQLTIELGSLQTNAINDVQIQLCAFSSTFYCPLHWLNVKPTCIFKIWVICVLNSERRFKVETFVINLMIFKMKSVNIVDNVLKLYSYFAC